MGGWLAGGWLEKLELRLNSASVEVEVELSRVEAELGNNNNRNHHLICLRREGTRGLKFGTQT